MQYSGYQGEQAGQNPLRSGTIKNEESFSKTDVKKDKPGLIQQHGSLKSEHAGCAQEFSDHVSDCESRELVP